MLNLCRTLLAAVAVSCTLSRIHANGPSTQPLDRIKDLMCILLLNGVQKEDLDANVLNKLQRYNVNIHDLNNNDLRHECTTNDENITNYKNVTHHTRNIVSKNTMDNTPIVNGDSNYNLKLIKAQDYDNYNINTFDKYNSKDLHAIQYVDGQPDLQSVLKFWKDIKMNNTIKTTETPIALDAISRLANDIRWEQKNKRNVPNVLNSNESDAIQKLLVKVLSENENKNKGIDKYNKNDIIITPYNVKNYYDSTKNLKLNSDSEKGNLGSTNLNNFDEILKSYQLFKTYYPIIPKDRIYDNLNVNNRESISFTTPDSFHFNKLSERKNIFTTEKIFTSIIEEKLSKNVIAEIAKTVKELVLKDLRNEIFETTRNPTTPLPTIPNTLSTRGNLNAEQTILNKFMDLYEEIKTLNHKTLIISSEIRKKTVNGETHTVAQSPIFPDLRQLRHKSQEYSNIDSDRTYNFSPQLHKFRSNTVSESALLVPVKPNLPITVQTNSLEIPPLGIPVDKPENPVNQNIIVPTLKPYRIGEYKVDYNKIIKPSDFRDDEEYLPKQQPQVRFAKFKQPSANHPKYENDNRFRVNKDNSNYYSSLNDKLPGNKLKESVQGYKEMKHPDIPRFHEQLEGGTNRFDTPRKEYVEGDDCCNEKYSYSQQMVECCNRKIASRQQMSLSNIKSQPSYDDTHFKNFLKSHQKVTVMLERILASRSRVPSVETM